MNNTEIIDKINIFYNEKKYKKCIKLYKIILLNDNYKNNLNIYMNMAICYLKSDYYKDAKEYILLYINNNSNKDNHQSWGIYGAALYGLKNLKESLNAYTKAYEISKYKIYNIMINKINNLLNNKLNINKTIESLLLDNNLINKINTMEFQNKLKTLQKNPLDAIKDPEIMNIMNTIMEKI